MSKKWVIGSRGSELALWQAHHVQGLLKANGVEAEIKIIQTKGDRVQNLSFNKIEGKGFFTKELEDALLNQSIDFAVHSCKDLETTQPDGLKISAFLSRNEVRDVLVIKDPNNPVYGTSSVRRKSQLLRLNPNAKFVDIRGNVPTRIKKLRENDEMGAIILAKAGLDRIQPDLNGLIIQPMSEEDFVPAAGQGALAIQARENHSEANKVLEALNEPAVAKQVEAERNLLSMLGGGCQKPVGIHVKEANLYKVFVSHAPDGNVPGVITQFELENLSLKKLQQVASEVKKKSSFFIPDE